MHFLTKIKFANITNLADARFAAAAGIDYLGFCFNTNCPSYIPPIKAKEIIDWITGTEIVAEFGEQSIDEINTISELLNVELIELHNALLPDQLKLLHKPLIKKIDTDLYGLNELKNEIAAYKNVAVAFHLFSASEKEFVDSERLIDLCKEYKIIWGYPIITANAANIVSTYMPYAINISGRMEETNEVHDFDDQNELFDSIRVEN